MRRTLGALRGGTIGGLIAIPLVLSFATGCPELWDIINGNTNTNTNVNTNSAANENVNENINANTTGNSGLTGKYVGSTRCSLCHVNKHTDWSETLHAKALEALEAIGQGSNAECVGCHTVGFGEVGGFVNRATTNDLASVGCEACHGPGGDHVSNIEDATKRPVVSISASVCGACHTGEHQPNYEDWQTSRHGQMQESLKEEFTAGTNAATCGLCHSGDVFVADHEGETIAADYLKGIPPEELNPVVCAVCHSPHKRTGNAAAPDEGRDYQLRFPQVKFTTPSNVLADAINPDRFNLCGQCHHARNRVWTDSSREPHPSDQVNVFFGEMPLPDADQTPIVAVRPSVHLNAPEQCSTCHVFRKPIEEGIAPAVSGHTFMVNFEACAACHSSAEIAENKLAILGAEIDYRAGLVEDALNEWALSHDVQGKGVLSWEFTSEGGPSSSGQAKIPNAIKKARYIFYYVIQGGGNGAHNPDYVRDALQTALEYVETNPDLLP
ncbi:MAG: hypothetical protein HZB38_06510 [Planctomycetes bacterium]|nr:hypothetical protein [Planctomycetota bacterium]